MIGRKKFLIILIVIFISLLFVTGFSHKAPFIWPLSGDVITKFMEKYYDVNSDKQRIHTGLDIAGEAGSKIFASGNGYVSYIGFSPIGGRTVVVQHNEKIKSNYLNLQTVYVKKGQFLKQGDLIGIIGADDDPSNGKCHLHFAIVYDGAYLDPEDVFKIDYSSISEYIRLVYIPSDFRFSRD